MDGGTKKKQVLVIDDHEPTRMALMDELKEEFEVTGASGWIEVGTHLEAGTRFDFYVIDQVLQARQDDSGRDGIDVAQYILAEHSTARVIVYTFRPDEASYNRAYNTGVLKYIVRERSDLPALLRQLGRDLPHFVALNETLKARESSESIIARYIQKLGCGVSIIDRYFGLWYRNDEHVRMLEGFEEEGRGAGFHRGAPCWVEHLCRYDQDGPCRNCPAEKVFKTKRAFRTPVPLMYKGSKAYDKRPLVKYFDMTSSPVFDDGGEIIGVTNTVIDVTEREQLIAIAPELETTELIDERIALTLEAIRALGYDRVRYYQVSADRSIEGRAMILHKIAGHRAGDRPDVGKRLPVLGDPYWENTLDKCCTTPGFIYGDNEWNPRADYLGDDPHQEELCKQGVKQWMELPLVVKDQVVATICIDNKYAEAEQRFDDSDLDRLARYIDAAARSIYNLRNYQAMRALAMAVQELRTVDSSILQGVELEGVLDQVLGLCLKYTGATSGYIRLAREDYLETVCEIGNVAKLVPKVRIDLGSQNRTARVFLEKTPSIVHDAQSDREFHQVLSQAKRSNTALFEQLNDRKSFGIFPIKYALGAEENAVGVLVLGSNDREFFTDEILMLIDTYCQKAASLSLMYQHQELTTSMARADRMAALGAMLAGISHGLRNPVEIINRALTTARQQMDILEETARKEGSVLLGCDILDDLTTLLRCSSVAACRIHGDVTSLNLFSHPGKEAYELVDINSLLNECVDLLRNDITGMVSIVKELDAGLPVVQCSLQNIRHALVNILQNAIQGVDTQGTIRIKTTRVGRRVEVVVGNTGDPITQDARRKIFDPYFTTKEPGKGTGLGLAIVYEVVRRHNGTVKVTRYRDETLFRVTLPIRQRPMTLLPLL